MADLSQIGKNIRLYRMRQGLTQRALADDVMVSFQAISAWERGMSVPDLENAIRLANYFGISVDALFADSDKSLLVASTAAVPKQNLSYSTETAMCAAWCGRRAQTPMTAASTVPWRC